MQLEPPDPPLHDEVVRLTPLGAEHVAAMRELGDDANVARFTFVRAPMDEESARAWVERYEAGWRDGSLAGFAIEAQEDREFLGFIALVRYDPEGSEGEIGYIVAPAARGRGVAGRALRLLTDWCLLTLRLERIELRIDVANVASVRVAERLGYVRDGVLRSAHFKEGVRVDLAVYSRLPGDG